MLDQTIGTPSADGLLAAPRREIAARSAAREASLPARSEPVDRLLPPPRPHEDALGGEVREVAPPRGLGDALALGVLHVADLPVRAEPVEESELALVQV